MVIKLGRLAWLRLDRNPYRSLWRARPTLELSVAVRPRPDETPVGELLRCAFGFVLALEAPVRPWEFRRSPVWLAPGEHCAASWTGREVEVLAWRRTYPLRCGLGYLPA